MPKLSKAHPLLNHFSKKSRRSQQGLPRMGTRTGKDKAMQTRMLSKDKSTICKEQGKFIILGGKGQKGIIIGEWGRLSGEFPQSRIHD